MPVLRCGVAPAVVPLAEEPGKDERSTRLEAVEASLSPVSVWTVRHMP